MRRGDGMSRGGLGLVDCMMLAGGIGFVDCMTLADGIGFVDCMTLAGGIWLPASECQDEPSVEFSR
jgi:hypothetical protein